MQPNQILVGHYQLVSPLGAGGFGHTYTARDLHLPGQPLCVIKQLTTVSLADSVLPIAQRLFEQEAQMLYALGEHPQIPRLLAHFEVEGAFYLAQEYVPGVPLSDRILPGQPWSEKAAIALAVSCLNVLSFVHQQGVIHRDIKPANLICRQPQKRSPENSSQNPASDPAITSPPHADDIVLIDFGAVKQVRQAGLTAGLAASTDTLAQLSQAVSLTIAIGTPGYMAIEQQSGQPRLSSDLYALGILLIQTVTGLASAELVPDQTSGEIEWRSHAPHLTPAFADFLDRLIRYDYRSRYRDARDARDALNALQTAPTKSPTSALTPAKMSTSQPLDRRRYQPLGPLVRKHPRRVGLATLGLALLSSGLIYGGQAYFSQQFGTDRQTPPVSSSGTNGPEAADNSGLTPEQIAQQANYQGIQTALEDLPPTDSVTLTPAGLIGPDGEPFELPGGVPSPTLSIPPAAYDLSDQADAQFSARNYAEAIALYEQAQRLGLDRSETLWKHCADLDQAESPDALNVCARVSGINDADSVTSFVIEASHQIAIDQPERALLLLKQADKIDSSAPTIRWARGRALAQLGQLDQALEELTAAVEAVPDSATIWVSQGEALLAAGRLEQAQAAATKALTLEPGMEAALTLSQNIQTARSQ